MSDYKFTIESPMPPLWMMFPHIHPYSIGWRMGYGEGYKFDLHDWKETLTEDEKKQYQQMFPPPPLWWNHYDAEYHEREGFYEDGIEFWQKDGKPKYSLDWLLNGNADAEYVFFWHSGDITHEPACCFSQWQYSEFETDDGRFTCTEQYMMAQKAEVFEDAETEEKIMNTTSPREMKLLGKQVKNFSQGKWDRLKYSIVLNGNYHKFAQNDDMRNILLSTGNKIIAEASPLDVIWGTGYAKSHEHAASPEKWRGQNLLGFVLMEVRDELRKVYQNYDKINWAECGK